MFSLFYGLWKYLFSNIEFHVLILGIDKAGKTVNFPFFKLIQFKILFRVMWVPFSTPPGLVFWLRSISTAKRFCWVAFELNNRNPGKIRLFSLLLVQALVCASLKAYNISIFRLTTGGSGRSASMPITSTSIHFSHNLINQQWSTLIHTPTAIFFFR